MSPLPRLRTHPTMTPCVHAPREVQEAANAHPSEKSVPMPCSPANASVLYPCDLTDAEWALLAAAAARQRALLCPTHRLCLALSPTRVSALANHVHDLP